MPSRRLILCFLVFAAAVSLGASALTARQKADNLESFEIVWRTVRDRHPDPKLNGLNWQAIHDATRPLIAKAGSAEEVRSILRQMLSKLSASHYAIIASDRYDAADAPAAIKPANPVAPKAEEKMLPFPQEDVPSAAKPEAHETEPAKVAQEESGGKLVKFGNLPESRLFFEARLLPGGAGYIRFNEFLDPVSIMPKFEAAVRDFSKAPGIVLDLRGNPGGIGIMAMGIAGFFVGRDGEELGEMKMRETTLKFVVFPRAETYAGPLAILVDAGSASTTEILAQGLQDLNRARIFGTRTAGAALPSDIVRLPNGDGFQFAQASYTSKKGRVLEGAGVTPDVEIHQTDEALAAGRDLTLEAAEAWISAFPVHP